MPHVFFQILFLGEKSSSWPKISELLTEPDASIHVHLVDSLADLFQALARGRWQGVAIDVHAWNFQGLHYVEKVRSEYPALPIIALFSRSIPELDTKATTCGASGCIAIDHLTAAALHNAVSSAIEDVESQLLLDRDLQTHLSPNDSGTPTLTFTKNQVITHALNNLLCVISANADLLSDSLDGSASHSHPLSEIKKATRSAAALMRHLK